MPVAVVANRKFDVGVPRDANADINKNVDSDNLVTDVGVTVTTAGTDTNKRDLPFAPQHKTRIDIDGPIPFNAKNGREGKYQR